MKWRLALSLGLALLGRGGPAHAAPPADDSERNAARHLAEQGRDAFEKGNFELSRDLFQRAYALVQAPTLSLYEARSLARLGRLVEAEEAYLRAIRSPIGPSSPEAFRKAVREAEAEELQLQPRVPKVTIVVAGAGAQLPELLVTVDAERVKPALLGVEMPIDPGRHHLEAQVPGGEVASVRFDVAERERRTVEVRVDAPVSAKATPVVVPRRMAEPPPPPLPSRASWHRPAAFAAGGVAIAGLGTGIAAGLAAASKHADAERECPDRVCVEGSEGADSLSSFRSLRTVSTVGYIVGVAGLAAGVTFWLTAPSRQEEQAAVGVWMSASGAGLKGAF